MERQLKFISILAAVLLTMASYGSARAAGFALIEVNASGQGNAYAGAAAHTNDASTIFFNPAGMMHLDGQQLVFAGHYIDPSSDFSDRGSTLSQSTTLPLALRGQPLEGDGDDGGSGAFVPNFYWTKPLNQQTSFGLGVNTPFGLKTEYDDDWVGRYHGILSDLKTININPSIGYRVNDKLSIGGGLNFMLAEVELTNAIDFGAFCVTLNPGCATAGALPQQVDGKAELEGDNFDDVATGYNLGLIYMLAENTRLGVAYRSKIDIEADGEADFTVPDNSAVTTAINTLATVTSTPPLFVDTGLTADVTLPASLSVSIAHQVDKITWLADVTLTRWSVFDELRIEFDNTQPDSVTTESWKDSRRYSVGFDYQYSDRMVLRAGYALDETPVPRAERRTPRLPGDDRRWISLGLTYLVNNDFSIDIGYSHLTIDDARINNTFESGLTSQNAILQGEYDAEVDIFSAQLNWKIR